MSQNGLSILLPKTKSWHVSVESSLLWHPYSNPWQRQEAIALTKLNLSSGVISRGGKWKQPLEFVNQMISEKCSPLHNKTITFNWKGLLLHSLDNDGQEGGIVHSAGRLLQPSPGREGNQWVWQKHPAGHTAELSIFFPDRQQLPHSLRKKNKRIYEDIIPQPLVGVALHARVGLDDTVFFCQWKRADATGISSDSLWPL